MRFIYAAELKDIFTVYGSYYDLRQERGDAVRCRNVLEIFRRSHFRKLREPLTLSSSRPDSVFVMMNPGSSEPRQSGFREPLLDIRKSAGRLVSLEMVIAKPDVTQYQVMRVMQAMSWDHVRVVNLSDIREPKSVTFFRRVKKFETEHSDIHTVFSDKRKRERDDIFQMKSGDSPVVLGWGRDKNLLPLAEKAFHFLKNFRTAGVVSNEHPLLYRHPSPNIQTAKVEWLEAVRRHL